MSNPIPVHSEEKFMPIDHFHYNKLFGTVAILKPSKWNHVLWSFIH